MSMKTIQNEAGISLIEALATIVILCIALISIQSIFSNGMENSNKSQEKALLQQEANYIVTVLKELHEKNSNNIEYHIAISSDSKTITILNVQDSSVLKTIHNGSLKYDITPTTIIGKELPIRIKISSTKIPNLYYEINTTLSRL